MPASCPPATVKCPRIVFGDVHATIDGLKHGAGFLLYIDSGFITTLEGYSYEGTWPNNQSRFDLTYESSDRESLWKQIAKAAKTKADHG